MIISIYPISQRLGPAAGRAAAPAAGPIVPLPRGVLTAPGAALPSQNGFQKALESPGDPVWPSQSVPIPLGCGWRGWDCSPRIDEERAWGKEPWKGILPSGDLWSDFSQLLSVFQGEQKRDCTHGWVEDLKMCEFSV